MKSFAKDQIWLTDEVLLDIDTMHWKISDSWMLNSRKFEIIKVCAKESLGSVWIEAA
jgi:hypothetical protein